MFMVNCKDLELFLFCVHVALLKHGSALVFNVSVVLMTNDI